MPPLRQLQTRRMGVKKELALRLSLTFMVSWTGCVLSGIHVRDPVTDEEQK